MELLGSIVNRVHKEYFDGPKCLIYLRRNSMPRSDGVLKSVVQPLQILELDQSGAPEPIGLDILNNLPGNYGDCFTLLRHEFNNLRLIQLAHVASEVSGIGLE